MDPLKIPIRSTTQDHLEVEDIKDNIVILKDGSCCLILGLTAINFGLLSEKEQDAIIYAYAALLNSLTFPIQIVIRSQKKDISNYLKLLDLEIEKQPNALLHNQMVKYRKFVEETVKKNNVLDKKFYCIVPFSLLELGAAKSVGSLANRKKGLPYTKEYILEHAKMNLYPKRDHLIRQFGSLGLKVKEIATQEAIQLFYNIYNPESAGLQKLAVGEEYNVTFVKPSTV